MSESMKQLIFTCDGYDFWRDDAGRWNVAHRGEPAPAHCAYASPEPIAKLKGVNLRNIAWSAPTD
jgi:hypothetical protein